MRQRGTEGGNDKVMHATKNQNREANKYRASIFSRSAAHVLDTEQSGEAANA